MCIVENGSFGSREIFTLFFQLDEVKDIQEEIARLEFEQHLIDETAAQVETRLREAMKLGMCSLKNKSLSKPS